VAENKGFENIFGLKCGLSAELKFADRMSFTVNKIVRQFVEQRDYLSVLISERDGT